MEPVLPGDARLKDAAGWLTEAFLRPSLDEPLSCFWWLIVAWGVSYFFAVRPSTRIYERQSEDLNPLRIFTQFLTSVLIPVLLFWSLTDRIDEILAWGALIVFATARYFTRVVAVNGPDAESDRAFEYWVRILCEGETKYLIDNFWKGKASLQQIVRISVFLGFCLLLVLALLAFAFASYAIAKASGRIETNEIAISVGALFSGVSAATVLMAWIVAQFALGMQSVSFPVRYAVAANSLQVFLSATWVGLYPWFAYEHSAIDVAWKTQAFIVVVAVYLGLVVWPIWRWRARFRTERLSRLSEFKRILNRVLVATAAYDGAREGAAHRNSFMEYRITSMRKAIEGLQRTLRSIVSRSPFRALCMLHLNEIAKEDKGTISTRQPGFNLWESVVRWFRGQSPDPPFMLDRDRVLAAHRRAAGIEADGKKHGKKQEIGLFRRLENWARGRLKLEPLNEQDCLEAPLLKKLNPYESYVNQWVVEEKANENNRSHGASSRLLDALRIRNPQLIKMVKTQRYGIERTDYRYRLMYWIGRLLAQTEPDDVAHLNQLAKEALTDIEALERRTDSRSLILIVGGAIGTLLVALTQGLASNPILAAWFR